MNPDPSTQPQPQPQPLPILSNVAMAITAKDVHAAASAFASHPLPPLTLRIAAQSHEHSLFAQVYGQPASVPSVYLLRQGRVLATLDAAAVSDTALVTARIAQALGIHHAPAPPQSQSQPQVHVAPPSTFTEASVAAPQPSSQPPTESSSSSESPKQRQPTTRPATADSMKSSSSSKSRTIPKSAPAAAPAPTPAPTTAPTPTAPTVTDPDSIALAIRHLDASVSRHTYSLSSTTLADLATDLSSAPYHHGDHGLMQSYPTRIALYTSSTMSLAACGLQGPSATLVVRPPLQATLTRNATAAANHTTISDRVRHLFNLLIGWIQALLMLAVRAWLKVGGHRPAASDPGMAPTATVVRKRRLQTLADLKRDRQAEDKDKGPVEAYNGNSTSHEQ
ncbi:hypothetical protein BCR44DRAFT_1437685 [Catenaria anguillulae PL171]|uniref:Uncharacterized protein n=1 Tax=Catenaria anguillulae PL171 TaxID=765915 RepID=A0A1Y2HGX1_9FUNG|nr:hypothetical protein BCR44DRAFT_1437685 [Catenaria anguillulae PL171]